MSLAKVLNISQSQFSQLQDGSPENSYPLQGHVEWWRMPKSSIKAESSHTGWRDFVSKAWLTCFSSVHSYSLFSVIFYAGKDHLVTFCGGKNIGQGMRWGVEKTFDLAKPHQDQMQRGSIFWHLSQKGHCIWNQKIKARWLHPALSSQGIPT